MEQGDTMIKSINLLNEMSKEAPYFWNSLFIVLYEDKRKIISIEDGRKGESLVQLTYTSKSVLHDYLACRKPLSCEECIKFCKAINVDILSPNFEALKYGNMALDYLKELKHKKLSSKGKLRNKTIEKIESYNNDVRIEYEIEESWNFLEKQIINSFDGLSITELTYLYQIADILLTIDIYDMDFIHFYTDLNSNGKTLFKEALAFEPIENSDLYEDECTRCYAKLSSISKQNITQSQKTAYDLADKLGEIGMYSPEAATELCKFINMDSDTWDTLIKFHQKISLLTEENIGESTINEKQSLIIFLNWLWNLQSLRK